MKLWAIFLFYEDMYGQTFRHMNIRMWQQLKSQ